MKSKLLNTALDRFCVTLVLTLGVVTCLGFAGPVMAQSEVSVSPVMWTWGVPAAGSSRLVRRDSGISASFHTEDLPPGQAFTMWFVVFNNPGACWDSPCSNDDFFLNPDTQADFLWGAGNVVGGSGTARFAGHLQVGDISGSGWAEFGLPELSVGLIDPWDAEVHLLLHSHGPIVPGPVLQSQLNSFLGGCEVFLGDEGGFAEGPDDIPDAVGECVTLLASIHQ